MTKKKREEETAQSDEALRRKTGLVSFGEDVRRLLAPVLGKKGFIQADILSHWKDILGQELSCGVRPYSVSFSKATENKAVLHVQAYSGAFAVEFTARKEQILQRINAYFGYPAITEIKVTQGGFTPTFPSPAPSLNLSPQKKAEIQDLTSSIENEALRDAVTELGLNLAAAKK